jgi:hypothetical protein
LRPFEKRVGVCHRRRLFSPSSRAARRSTLAVFNPVRSSTLKRKAHPRRLFLLDHLRMTVPS